MTCLASGRKGSEMQSTAASVPPNGQVQVGILVGKAIKFRLFFRRDEAFLVFKHKVGTANDHSVFPTVLAMPWATK